MKWGGMKWGGMQWGVVLLSAVLAGCHAGPDLPLGDQAFCARQAEDDPAVKDLIMKGVGNPHFQREGEDQLHAAVQDARVACLRKRGIIPPGGVERQKPS